MAGKIIADIIEAPYDAIRMNVANVTVLTANSSGLTYVPTGNVNINIGGASANLTMNLLTANGIKFPATQVSSTDANTLDDYEEGTATPRVEDANGTTPASYTHTAKYVKIGRTVFVDGNISVTSNTGPSTSIQVYLPFVVSSGEYNPLTIYHTLLTYGGSTYIVGEFRDGTSFFHIKACSSNGGGGSVSWSGTVPNGCVIRYSGTYRTTA